MVGYGRGHGTRETCALHTARLSCDTLVDFWSALGEETRTSLLRMKEEDFIERLMYRFDSKRFCRDCRRNVIREFKELKELKRMRRELRCTSCFCVADTEFQYEVSEDTVQADWQQSFSDSFGTYHRFEWAIGTGEGKNDIWGFEDVGMKEKVQVNGLDLGSLSACYITLRACKLDGRCTELCVKAHALKGQPCVHRRLVVGDGFVTITKGESIRSFFEHAEEAEEEEDDDATDKDGNELDGDGSRPQKHAKSPELAREFLLDAATVIFKEQVEKAFREGTARQNAHSIFVSLALKLLEERVHIACKEIITLEKQIKLLEEEEKEKREEEERKERRRMKEREKKLRRKERLKGKERERERKQMDSNSLHIAMPASVNGSPTSTHDESSLNTPDSGDSISDLGEVSTPPRPVSPDIRGEHSSNCSDDTKNTKSDILRHQCDSDGEFSVREGTNGLFTLEQSKSSRRKLRFKKDSLTDQTSKWYDKHPAFVGDEGSVHHIESDTKFTASPKSMTGGHRPLRERVVRTNTRSLKFGEKFHCASSRVVRDRYDFQSCSCSQNGDYRPKDGYHIASLRSGREIKTANKIEHTVDVARPMYRGGKYNHGCLFPDNCSLPKGKLGTGTPSRDLLHTKQVWEPTGARKKCTRSNSDPDVTSRTAVVTNQPEEIEFNKVDIECSADISGDLGKADTDRSHKSCENSRNSSSNGSVSVTKSDFYSKDGTQSTFPMSNGCGEPIMSSSSSDNCSSCLSEGDSVASSSSAQNAESSSTSDSEDASPQSKGRDDTPGNKYMTNGDSSFTKTSTELPVSSTTGASFQREEHIKSVHSSDNGGFALNMIPPQQPHLLPTHNQSMHLPCFPSPTVGYHNQSAVPWPASPANGLMPYSQPNHFVYPSSPLGYSLPSNGSSEFGMRYTPLHTIPTPLFNAHHHSMYQTSNRVYVANLMEQTRNYSSVAEPIKSMKPLERPFVDKQFPSESPLNVQNGGVGSVSRSQNDTDSFSLFHFGGPMVGAGGFVNPLSAKEEGTGRSVSKSASTPSADISCSKEETAVEEYSLFAVGNGTRFSFF